MYTIKLPVPFALMVVAGIMPVIRVKWKLKVPPCRVLIYADSAKKPLSSYPVELQMIAHNAEVFGNIPHFVDQVTKAIVGWADIAPGAEIPRVWNNGEDLCRVFNAHTLDVPYFCDIKQDGINFNLSPDLFTAHRKKINHIYGMGKTLYVPVNARIWEQSAHGTSIVIDLIGEAAKCLITEADTLREYDSIVIHHNGMYREFEFSSRNSITPYLDERGKLKLFPSALRGGKKAARTGVTLFLDHELDT